MKVKYAVWILILFVIVGLGIFGKSMTGYLNKTVLHQTCKDSDYRVFFKSRSIYEKGSVVITAQLYQPLIVGNYSDACIDKNTLQEYYCGWNYMESTWEAKFSTYDCLKGCEDCACAR